MAQRFYFLRKRFGIPLLGVLGGIASYELIKRDEGTHRSLQFWSKIFPAYVHYRYYQILNEDLKLISDEIVTQKYNDLHEIYSPIVRDIVYGMRGFYLKNAQLVSTQDDIVPPAYMKWIKDTQDKVPSVFTGSEAKEFCKSKMKIEMNLDFDEIFSSWDDDPIGVASIGQVHKAVLRSTGKVVAVKLLCPGIENRFRSDIHTLKTFCSFAMPQHVTAFKEIEKQFGTEFNYVEEAKNLSLIRNNILPKWNHIIEIPAPYHEYCSKHILVMEYLDGVKLVDGIRENYRKMALLQGKSIEQLEKEMQEGIKNGTIPLDSLSKARQKNLLMSYYTSLSDIVKGNGWRFMYNYSVFRLMTGPLQYQWSEIPIDLASIIETLCHVHANELFVDGAFNGDAHPGNILLLKNGRLGLIDYGQVKHIPLPTRIAYAKLIVALSKDDKEEIVRLFFDEIHMETKYKKKDIAYLLACFWNDRDTPEIMQGKNIHNFLDWAQSQDPVVQLPEDFIFMSRLSLLLRGMGKAFGIRLRMSTIWEREATQLLRREGVDYKYK